ncbi:DEAD/DEAH box helicase [Candidatus Woesearchaeota archaeon]|nr:DEAD/DEAH box helicase [Candidatus Woesearchaeota archaeon]
MNLSDIADRIPADLLVVLKKEGITTLRPSQEKAINAGLLDYKSVLVCTPTASGKTLIAELAGVKSIMEGRGKVVYIVPLIALASEKHKEFVRKYQGLFKIAQSSSDVDASDSYLSDYDFIVCTAEKFDSLIRHQTPWLKYVKTVIIDEIHLINDVERGPTLEILITILKQLLKDLQIVGLSATIGNPEELAEWLGATLVIDGWRPVELKKGVYLDGTIDFS